MAAWVWMAVAYAAFMATVAIVVPIRRRPVAVVASILFAVASVAIAAMDDLRIQVLLPGGVVLLGYWLSGLFIGTPQPWLERWLLESDRRLFERFRIDRALAAAPLWLLAFSELAYSTVYLVVVAGALVMAPVGREAVIYYWSLVLPAEFICYGALPFLRCRPPRSLEPAGVIARRDPPIRHLNDRLVGSGSIQVNTIPSGHVAGALAAGLAVVSWQPVPGALLIVCAGLIAIAATVGRYHYAVDCVLGAVVAIVLWTIV